MHKALKDAFESFCNKQVGTSSTPELMANFCDTLLRKGGGERLTDDELEATLDKVVKLLVYINDRDMFRCRITAKMFPVTRQYDTFGILVQNDMYLLFVGVAPVMHSVRGHVVCHFRQDSEPGTWLQ